uniref:Ubiquitin carboxyl-terminal hydrolase n=1 Tax=Esox lucius TaxID=8010 RepID=A0A6Q2YJP2_ESOLU
MASHSNQYIFGEFSPDEINQFFVTPRCYVELPPFNDKVLLGRTHAVYPSSLSSPSAGEDYQRIEFGVDEVMNSDPVGVKDPLFKVSSTLNPQAPEFILGSTAPSPVADVPDGAHYNSLDGPDGPDSEPSAMDNNPACPDGDGGPGSLGQRERKKKKKRPPGYYNYLEGSEANSMAPVPAAAVDSPAVANQRTCDSPESPCPTSPPPPSAAVVSPPATTATAEEEETGDIGVANGLAEPHAVVDGDVLREDSEAGEPPQPLAPAPPVEPDSEDQVVVAAAAELAQSPAPPTAPAANPPKSWASLFHNSKPLPGGPQAYVEVKNIVEIETPSPAPVELPEKAGEVKETPVHVSEDPMAPKLAELIENVKLIHKPVSLQPRGLINKGNWCYINATLQALIACPPMYHLMKSIPLFTVTQRPCTSTPMMDNFVRLVNEFSNMPVPSKAKQQAAGEKMMKDIRPGVPFEPNYVYRLLTLIKSSLSEKGRQEDAEEYLGFTLNGLHEEMLALKKLISPQEDKAPTPNGPESQSGLEENAAEKDEEGSGDEWEQVGPRNKTSITRQADFVRTPVTDIFGGHIRSVVYQQNSKESATLQPFFTLQLDIQSEKIRTVQEALETLVARESVQGYTTKSKQEIEISRRVTLEELPPVLVLHLKRFVFEKTGGCQKLIKNIDYPVDLEISKDLLSSGVRSKISKGQRTYRLFAVVYHHGNSATGGHYTTDVFHIGLNGWLRIDDQAVKVINQYQVVKQTAERTAYLLYYRRVDLL